MNDSQSQPFAIGQGTELPPSENLLEIEKDLVSRGFLRERSLSARQSDTSAGLTGEKQIFCDSFLS